jgi:hypothetical protein
VPGTHAADFLTWFAEGLIELVAEEILCLITALSSEFMLVGEGPNFLPRDARVCTHGIERGIPSFYC